MDFEKFSKETVGQINKELKRLLGEWRNEVRNTSVKLLPLVDKFIDSCQGGKRIRGVLVVMGYRLGLSFWQAECVQNPGSGVVAGVSPQNDIYRIAAAYEIFHTAILAHDDIIDQSELRRGQPSLYQALGGNHHGISQAISLGDAGFFLASRVILKTIFDDRQKLKALRWFCQTMLDTALGQMLDIMGQDQLTAARFKTARYTIAGPLVLGAVLGKEKNDKRLLKNLAKFGENLGIAFQIKDDILDAETDFWGGVDQAKKAAEKYKNKALRVLPSVTKDKEMSKLLEQMAEYLVQRTK